MTSFHDIVTIIGGALSITLVNIGHCQTATDEARLQFERIDKSFNQSARFSEELSKLRAGTSEFPRRYIMALNINPDSNLNMIAERIGRLDILLGQDGVPTRPDTCTAFVLSSTIIITNNHCIYPSSNESALAARYIDNYASFGSESYHIYQIDPKPIDNDATLDFALLKSKSDLPYDDASFGYRQPRGGETLVLISHPLGQGKRVSNLGCIVAPNTEPDSQIFIHGCPTLGGSSGALIFAIGDLALVGLHRSTSGDEWNEATGASSLLSRAVQLRNFFTRVEPPPRIDTSGTPMSEAALEQEIRRALRESEGADTFTTLLASPEGAPRQNLNGKSMLEISVEEGSYPVFGRLLALQKPSTKEGANLVRAAIALMDRHATSGDQILTDLLQLGIPVPPDENGLMPHCGNHSSQTRALIRSFLPAAKRNC